eukprot:GHVP01010446.1.p1 GENE.GHVP01010446.1~~GHVP01010446.1.p1  ORF type:complete len:217 (+),score=28.13 GHVP01010446.1:34-651(+)
MELLKKISDDVSNTAVCPPNFVQNDDQEAGGLNFRMMAANDLTQSMQSDYPKSSATPQADQRITISFSSEMDPKEKKCFMCLRHLITNCGEIKRPTGSSACYWYYPETKGGCCQARGWTEDGNYCVRWCSYPEDHCRGSPKNHPMKTEKMFEEQDQCHCDAEAQLLNCGIWKIEGKYADKEFVLGSGERVTAKKLFKAVFSNKKR